MTCWHVEDGGSARTQVVAGRLDIGEGDELSVTTRTDPVVTMVVGGCNAPPLLLRHSVGDFAASIVERIDPVTLVPLDRSPELPGGPVWPGGAGIHPNGSIYVVFGNHAHCLDADLHLTASRRLPRDKPYNSFVILEDGHLVTKDFGGSRPGVDVAPDAREPCELVVLDADLEIVDLLRLDEPSIARLSANGDDVYVVGDSALMRVHWDGRQLREDESLRARYRLLEGQTYGWDCVIAAGAAWFLDDGDGSERFDGTLRGKGLSTTPLHLVRVDLVSSDVRLTEVCDRPGGLVANPPIVDVSRRIAVGYDSGNGVIAGFDLDTLEPIWRRDQDHASHLLLYEGSGELVTGDGADVVVLAIGSGREVARAATGSGMQSVLFPAPGPGRSFYVCSLATVTRVSVERRGPAAQKV